MRAGGWSGKRWRESREVRRICAVPHPSVRCERTCFKQRRNVFVSELMIPSVFPYTGKWFGFTQLG